MTPTERARRSNSLYHDKVTRRELCDRIAFLESDLEEAQAAVKFAKVLEGAVKDGEPVQLWGVVYTKEA